MSNKLFLPFVGSSQSSVEDVVVKYLGRDARVSPSEYQGIQGYMIRASGSPSTSVLEKIKSEVRSGRTDERASESGRASRRGSDASSDRSARREPPSSDLSSGILGQSYGMRPIPEHRVLNADDGLALSRHASRPEGNYSGRREYADSDSMSGSLPSHYPSPLLSMSRPIPIPSNQRRPSTTSEGSPKSFDSMWGFRESVSSSHGRQQSSRHEQEPRHR